MVATSRYENQLVRSQTATDKLAAKLARPSFAAKVETLTDLMVYDNLDIKAAATQAGINHDTARVLLRNVKVIQSMRAKVEVLRTSEGPVNMHVARAIRDRAMSPDATAAQQTVSLKAVEMLEGDDKQASITIKGGNNLIAGYVVKLTGPSEGPRAIGNRMTDASKPLINHEDVTDV